MLQRFLTAFAFLATATVALAPAFAQQPQMPPAVVAGTVEVKSISDPAVFSGTVEAIDEVDLIARVQGFLESVEFDAGDFVQQGQVLFRIETQLYDAAVTAAEAGVAQARAQLLNAEQQLRRQQTLTERNVAAQALLEEATAAEAAARANLAVAEAQLQRARIEQGYTTITAPFAGEISRALYSEGALVGPSSGPLARLVKTDPVRVAFSISDTLLIEIRSREAAGETASARDYAFRVILSNGEEYPVAAEPEYVANQTDPATGTVPVRLVLPNPDRILIPGQFVNVSVGPADPPQMPVVPQLALLQDREGRYVYVVNDDSTVSQRRIRTGAQVGNELAVVDGLSGGERIVVQGLQRLSDGMAVQVAAPPAGSAE